MYSSLKQYYDVHPDIDSKLPKLLPSMLRFEDQSGKKSPKLRAKGGECRGIIGWLHEISEHYLDAACPEEACMLQGGERLKCMYTLLRSANWDAEAFDTQASQFLLLFGALEDHLAEAWPARSRKIFRVKPKGHLLTHLALSRVNPASHWCYRDEAFGHTLALLAKRRGGGGVGGLNRVYLEAGTRVLL